MESNDRESIDDGTEDAREEDGDWQVSVTRDLVSRRLCEMRVPVRFLEFLDHEVQVVPSVVREQSRVEGECDLRDVSLSPSEAEVLRVSCAAVAAAEAGGRMQYVKRSKQGAQVAISVQVIQVKRGEKRCVSRLANTKQASHV